MTLRLRRHFTTRTALYTLALAFFWAPALALICLSPAGFRPVPVDARISTASGSERGSIKRPIDRNPLATARGTDSSHTQEQKAEKKQNDSQWKIQTPFPTREPKSQEPKSQEPKSQEPKSQEPKGQETKSQEQKKQDEPLLRIETDLVQIDVVVADKQGKLARDLKRADFELFDDGKKQEITHFAVGTAAQPARWLAVEKKKPAEQSSAESTPVEIRAGRYIVIAVDDFHLAPENLIIAKRTLQRFIDNQMIAGDQVAIATTSGNIGMFQQFTSERDVLERAINRLNPQQRTATSSSDVPRITDYQAELIDIGDQDALELAVQEILRLEPTPMPAQGPRGAGGRGGLSSGASSFGASPRDRAIQQAQSRARMIVAQNAHYTRSTLSNLESVIRNLRNLTGRKLLVLLSDGFHLGGNSSSQIYDMRRIIDAATRAGVVIYSIDARGLVATPPGGSASDPYGADDITLPGARGRIESSAIQAKLDGLNALARDTGGTLFKNSNDLNLGLQRVLDANETYYVLAYEPSTPYRDGRFHKIEVRVADRPDLIVRTRKGYFAPSDKTGELAEKSPDKRKEDKRKEKSPEKIAQQVRLEKEKEMREGLGSLVPLREIPVEMAVDFLEVSNGNSGALVNLHVDASQLNLRLLDGRHQSELDLLMALFDEKGKAAASFVERINVNIRPERLENALKHGFSYRRLMALKPGFYQARVAIREEGSSRMGSASKWVEVPDIGKKQLTLSGVLLSAGKEDQNDLQAADSAYIPQPSSATRRFKKDGAVDFMVFAYNAKVEKTTVDLVIQSQVFSGSKLVYASPIAKMTIPESADLLRIPYAARISMEGFIPGQYELRVVVIDRLTKATAFRRVYFTVE
jgi:VWFA-related protein